MQTPKRNSLFLILAASSLLIFNITKVDFTNPFNDDSTVALITVIASLCVIVLMLILRASKKIEQKVKQRK